MQVPQRRPDPSARAARASRAAPARGSAAQIRAVPGSRRTLRAVVDGHPAPILSVVTDEPDVLPGPPDLEDDLFRVLVAVRRRQARLDPVHHSDSLVDQIATAMIGPLDADELELLASILAEIHAVTAVRDRSAPPERVTRVRARIEDLLDRLDRDRVPRRCPDTGTTPKAR